MKLTPPKKFTYYVSLLIFIIGILVSFFNLLGASSYGVILIAIAFVLLALGNLIKGL